MSAAPAAVHRGTTLGGALRRVRLAVSATIAAVLGLAPHVLHHAGPLAGAALLGGVGGSLLFGAAGLALSAPFLLRVHRRCGNWRVPAALLVTFAAIFSVSTFVVGPAISGADENQAPAVTTPDQTPPPSAHEQHH